MALSPVEQTYRTQLATVRARVVALVEREYNIDPDAIGDSFDAFAERVAPTIAVGQSAAVILTAAFMAQLAAERGVDFEPEGDDDIPGTNAKGEPLAPALASAGGLILGQIADGRGLAEALDYGRFLATSFADNETRGAADRLMAEAQRRPEVTGWHGEAGDCERCQVNQGDHDSAEEPYRHPGCTCLITPILAA